jgi:hypothetical protein
MSTTNLFPGVGGYDASIRDAKPAKMIHVSGYADSTMTATVAAGERGSDDDPVAIVAINCIGSDGLLSATVSGNTIELYARDHGEENIRILAKIFREVSDELERISISEDNFQRVETDGSVRFTPKS